MQKSIALALLFGSTSAVNPIPGPVPGSDDKGIMFGSAISITDSNEDTAFGLKSTAVTSPSRDGAEPQNTGLYGCLRGGNVPMATQGQKFTLVTDGALYNIQVVDQLLTARTFYQTDLLMQGSLAQIPTAAELGANPADYPWRGYDTIGAGAAGTDPMTAAAGIDGSYFECCTPQNVAADNEAARQCPTAFIMNYTGAIDEAVFSDVGVVNRLSLWSDENVIGVVATNAVTVFNEDFILGAMGQLSDDVGTDVNWCSMGFKTAVTSTAETYSAIEGFNSKTKCSWQVSAPVLSAPQFALKDATTADNLIQWVEWVGPAGVDAANTYMTTGAILEPAQVSTASSLDFNFGIGNYPLTEGTFFNPFTEATAGATTLYSNDGITGTQAIFDTTNNGPKKYSYNSNIAGSPGNAKFFQNSADNLEYKNTNQLTTDLDMGIFTTVLDYAKPAYASYDSALTTFNTDAAAYNEAVDAYNTALEAKEKELPVVMERPCPPTKPAAVAGLVIRTDTDWDDADIEGLTTGVAVYIAQNSLAADHIDDSKRYGYIMSSIDEDSYKPYVPSTAHAGHVFGRLGQGAYNMPDMVSPWKWDAGTTAATDIQFMMVSIFPESGPDYNVNGVLAAGESINIEISTAAYSLTNGFEMPSASATAALALTDKDAAQALVFSAVALAAAVASLY